MRQTPRTGSRTTSGKVTLWVCQPGKLVGASSRRAAGGEATRATGAAAASNAPARATRARRDRVKPPSFPARSAGVKGAARPRDTLRAMVAPGRRLTIVVLAGIFLAGLAPRVWRLTVPGLT